MVTPGAQSGEPLAYKLGLSLELPLALALVVAWRWRSGLGGAVASGPPKGGVLRIGHGSAAAGAPMRWAGMGTDGSTAGPLMPCAGTGRSDCRNLGPTGTDPSQCIQYGVGQVPVFGTIAAPLHLLQM